MRVVQALLGLRIVSLLGLDLLLLETKLGFVLSTALLEFFIGHVDLVLKHFNLIFMSRSIVTSSLLVLLKHRVKSLGVSLLLVVESLLKPLLFLLVKGFELGELIF